MIQGSSFRILACYHDTDSLNFAEVCNRSGYPTDLGGYYLRGLVRDGYLEKGSRGQYNVTPKGKQEINLTYGRRLNERSPRLAVIIVAMSRDKFAVIKRRVQPFIGSVEWPAVSVQLGESIKHAAARALRDRLGVEAKPHFVGFFRRTDIFDSTTFDDKLFAVNTIEVPSGSDLLDENAVGSVELKSRSELLKVATPAKSLHDLLYFVEKSNSENFEEHKYIISATDLSQ